MVSLGVMTTFTKCRMHLKLLCQHILLFVRLGLAGCKWLANLKYYWTVTSCECGRSQISLFVISHDLCLMTTRTAKYADDSYLLIGSNHLGTAKSEFQHIQLWASRNNLCLNASKTKELIV